jgi:hypothetical protein
MASGKVRPTNGGAKGFLALTDILSGEGDGR